MQNESVCKERKKHVRRTAVLESVKSARIFYNLGTKKGSENNVVAEGVGFEPTVPLQARRFSRPVP
jgi:hypothetical protein